MPAVTFFTFGRYAAAKRLYDRYFEGHAKGFPAGCYRLPFDHPHWFLRARCRFTCFDVDAVRFGDQSLFVKKTFFEAGGFCEKHRVLDDQQLVKRLKKRERFVVLKNSYHVCTEVCGEWNL